MIVTVGSIRGAPGATSWALLLAAAWPREFDGSRVVLEADPIGGVVGARYGLGVEPGAVQLVTSLRRNGTGGLHVEGFGRAVDAGLFVVPGPETGEKARSVWLESAGPVAARVAADDSAWFVDVGRTDESNPSLAFVDHAKVALLVVGPRSEDLVQAPVRVDALRRRSAAVAVVICGHCAFDRKEVTDFCRADALWIVDASDGLVEEVGKLLGTTRARRSWLWRHALEVAAGVFQLAAVPARAGTEVAG